MLVALHRSRLSAPFLEHSTSRSNGADVDQVLTAVAKDVSFAAGGTAEAELCEGGAAVFDGTCSIAESQLHGSNVSPCASPPGMCCFDSTLCCLALLLQQHTWPRPSGHGMPESAWQEAARK
jgi:hypothetical protein